MVDNFKASTSKNGTVKYSYLEPDDGHGLFARIEKDGTLAFDIKAQGNASELGSGKDMF
ncbi:hypothetical protein [Aliikangiella maris]|uniref:Uncharacterized protein n=2 Tax=Aliikangiella maris TaxID=3162458 RepID=A0ABV3MUT6_9GAMM